MSNIVLRDYQDAGVEAPFQFWSNGGRSPLVVVPCGGGKSFMGAEMAYKAQKLGARVLCVTHVQELIEQNYDALMELHPGCSAGIYSSGLGHKDTAQEIIFGGVQSLFRNPSVIGRRDVCLVDEAHLISRNANTAYGKLFAGLREMNPNMVICGLTATPFRTDSGLLTQPWRDTPALFEQEVFTLPMSYLLQRGRFLPDGTEVPALCPVTTKATGARLSTAGLHTKQGEFITGEMTEAFDKTELNAAICDEIVSALRTRNAAMVFAVSVEHATHLHEGLVARGIKSALVLGDLSKSERKLLIDDIKQGRVQAAVNVTVLTTGFNCPAVDLIAFARPTQSAVL